MIPTVVERCVGIDIGKKFVVACLMVGPAAEDPRVELRQFGTFTEDLGCMFHEHALIQLPAAEDHLDV
jgi:hypothetical protein